MILSITWAKMFSNLEKKKYTLKLTFNLYIQVISWLANPYYTDISAELLPLPFLSSYLFTDFEWLQWQIQGRGPGVRVPLFLDKTEPTPLTWGSGSANGNVACEKALHLGESGEVTCEYRSDSAVSSIASHQCIHALNTAMSITAGLGSQ